MFNLLSEVKQIIFRVAIYIRLSREDLDKADSTDSLSVNNQKTVLMEYVKKNGYTLVDVYIDDGYTGTNFDRPAFKRMIKDIENGKIDMVITKDLSRLGRDYIATGEYVEKYFPLHNVRYVALLDGIDTFLDTCNNDIAPFKAVINDMYSRDNSKKIRTALKSMQQKGKWVGGCTPFGYTKDPKDKNHLIPDSKEAPIVKEIFRLAGNGMTYYQIKDKLTKDNVPTMCLLRDNKRVGEMSRKGIWSSKTVKGILSNELYLGDMVQNRRSRISYKIRKVVPNDKDDWIIVKNTHEALVDRKTFDKVQEMLKNYKVKPHKEIYRLLDGILFCGDCKHKISICKPNKRGYSYIVCNYYRMYSKQHLCTSHSFNYDTLEEIVINQLKKIFEKCLNNDITLQKAKAYYKNANKQNDRYARYDEALKEIKKKKEQNDKMYMDKLEEKITEEMFLRISAKLNDEISKLEKEKETLSKYVNKNDDEENSDEECNKLIKEFMNNPTRGLVLKLIKRIEIFNDKSINIYFNFTKLNFLLEENNHN